MSKARSMPAAPLYGLEENSESGFPFVNFLVGIVGIGGGEDYVVVVFDPKHESACHVGLYPNANAGELIGAIDGLDQGSTGIGADHAGSESKEG